MLALYALRSSTLDETSAAMLSLCAYALPIVFLEVTVLRSFARASTGLNFMIDNGAQRSRVAVKLVGLYGTFIALAFLYWLIPEYHKEGYEPFWHALGWIVLFVSIAAIPYFSWIDRRQCEPEDGFFHCGRALLGAWGSVDRTQLWQYLLGWLVKAFYLPLMFTYVVRAVAFVRHAQWDWLFVQFVYTHNFFWELLFLIDTALATIGYVLTLRILDAHIRTVEPTLSGWVAALICYEPFWSFFYIAFFAYNADQYYWGTWLQDSPVLYWLWGISIMTMLVCYVFSHVAFGIRFSNLTHRGIVTNGLYRWTKHPAYVAKNIMWWLVTVPFVATHGILDAVRDCIMLGMVNLIYYARARTEERHLSWDPTYIQYALAMNTRSLFSPLARVFPVLRYRPPMQPVAGST